MALNKIISEGIKDGEVKAADIAVDAVQDSINRVVQIGRLVRAHRKDNQDSTSNTCCKHEI